MKLEQLFPFHYLSASPEERKAFIEQVRYRKHEVKPALQKHKKKAAKKKVKTKSSSVEKLLASLSDEERDALIKQFEEFENDTD